MKKTARLEVKKEKQKAKHSNTFNPFSLTTSKLLAKTSNYVIN